MLSSHLMFGLHSEVMKAVHIQQPESLLAAKNMVEKLELTHIMTSQNQKHTKKKLQKAQHRDIQQRVSGGLHQSFQYRILNMKTCRTAQTQKTDSGMLGCTYAQKGANLLSCPERHESEAVWRSYVKCLPLRDRVGYLRRKSSVVTVDLEALMQEKEKRLSTDTTEAGMSVHPPRGRSKATRVFVQNRLL